MILLFKIPYRPDGCVFQRNRGRQKLQYIKVGRIRECLGVHKRGRRNEKVETSQDLQTGSTLRAEAPI
jgi:hypothetical protein